MKYTDEIYIYICYANSSQIFTSSKKAYPVHRILKDIDEAGSWDDLILTDLTDDDELPITAFDGLYSLANKADIPWDDIDELEDIFAQVVQHLEWYDTDKPEKPY